MALGNLCLVILAVLLPPVAVFIEYGCGLPLLINIGLCFLLYFPAMIHAVYLMLQKAESRTPAPPTAAT